LFVLKASYTRPEESGRLTVAGVGLLEPVEGRVVRAHDDRAGLRVLVEGAEAVLAPDARVLHASPGRGGVVAVVVVDPDEAHLRNARTMVSEVVYVRDTEGVLTSRW
jgi:hypothetical protein